MKNYCIKQKISNDKGITLVSLTITIVVLLIIAGVSVNIGMESLDSTRLQAFYMELETVQKRVDDIVTTNETFIDSNNNVINIKEHEDFKLTSDEKSILENIISELQLDLGQLYPGLTVDQFRYFTRQELDTILDLTEIEQNVFVHFESRTVISQRGKSIGGKTYYILRNNMFYPTQDTEKNEGEITSLNFIITTYGTNSYKIIVTPSNTVGDLDGTGILKYKKSSSKYWETASGLEIIVNELTRYDVEYSDNNNNTVSAIIEVSIDEDEIPTVTTIVE